MYNRKLLRFAVMFVTCQHNIQDMAIKTLSTTTEFCHLSAL